MTSTQTYDPMEGVTAATRKDELMDRLRRARAALRRQSRDDQKALAAIEERLQAKYSQQDGGGMMQAIVSSTEEEWKDGVEFLEEFDDLLPPLLHRIVIAGHALLGHIPVEPEPEDTTTT